MSTETAQLPEPKVFIQDNHKKRLDELLRDPPASVLTASVEAIKWLDKVRREFNQLK